MHSLKDQILNHIKPLIGLELSIARRAADLRNFQFGDTTATERGTIGKYALHIQCPWRIEGPNGIVTGRSDLWEPVEMENGFNWDEWDYETDGNLQNKKIGELLQGYDEKTHSYINQTKMLVVEEVRSDIFGGAEIYLSGGYRIVIFPDQSRSEQWRIFRPGTAESHFVVGTDDQPS